MNKPQACALSLWAIGALAAGCALFSKGDQGAARFFSFERALDRPPARKVSGTRGDPARLRLGRVTGAAHLEERLVFRDSANEVRYHRDLRWVEPPEQFLEGLLARGLFEERGLRRLVGGAGATLDVRLTAFDEIRRKKPLARAELAVSLHDDHLVLWEATVTVERPIVEGSGADLALSTVEALGEAMRAAVDQVVDRVVRELEEHSAGASPQTQ